MKSFLYKISILILILNSITSQCITGGGNPATSYDCLKNSDNTTNYCCMLSSPGYNPTNQMCVQMPVSSYIGQNSYLFGNLTYKLDCGNPYVTPIKGGPCGNTNPIYSADCWMFSNYDSSCCFYKSGNTTGTPGCQWLGKKKTGQVLNDDSIELTCTGTFNKVGLIVLLLALVFII